MRTAGEGEKEALKNSYLKLTRRSWKETSHEKEKRLEIMIRLMARKIGEAVR